MLMTDLLLQQLLNWIVLGSIYALIAVGFSLLFGVLNIIHFSHGDVSFVAPFVALGAVQAVAASFPVAGGSAGLLLLCLLLALLLTGLLGVVLEILVIRRFRDAPVMMALVATVALGIVLRELIRHLFPNGSNPHSFPRFVGGEFMVGGVTVSWFSMVAVACAIVAVAALFALLNKTRLGLHIRAVSQDRDAARLMSISPTRIFRFTFFIASAIGAVGALFFAGYANLVRFDFSVEVGLIGFSAAVVGGLGSMAGAIVGSLLIAGLDTFVQAVVPNGASYRLVFVFLLVIAVLVFKPSGIFGRTVVEKV
jgi:branched-chain amino acid transport system permease protein